MALGRLTMLPCKATHPRVNEQHKLDSLGSKINEDTQLHVWGRRVGLGGVGRESNLIKTILLESLKELIGKNNVKSLSNQ